ncbi:hypothetical protein PFISCL1PPCAC_22369, partial [Pristionchus fissidentatus]
PTSRLLARMGKGPWNQRRGSFRELSSIMDQPSTLILVAFRHGNRNPARFLDPNSKMTWGSEGELALNEIGRQQAHSLGDHLDRYLRRYGSPSAIDFYSSSADRCIDTMEIVKKRLGYGSEQTTVDDQMLRMYAVDHPLNGEVWKPVSSEVSSELTPELRLELNERKDLIEYLHDTTGWAMSVSALADLADNLEQMEKFGEELPSWIEKPALPSYDKARIHNEIMLFSEKRQISCALFGPCRDLMAAVWLKEIKERISRSREEHEPGRLTLAVYASHTEVILSVMRSMGMDANRVATAGGFIAEIRIEDEKNLHVKLFDHFPSGLGHEIVEAPLVKAHAHSIDDWSESWTMNNILRLRESA